MCARAHGGTRSARKRAVQHSCNIRWARAGGELPSAHHAVLAWPARALAAHSRAGITQRTCLRNLVLARVAG
eukprot:13770173-Alexandrium_andersonii.AAC.1